MIALSTIGEHMNVETEGRGNIQTNYKTAARERQTETNKLDETYLPAVSDVVLHIVTVKLGATEDDSLSIWCSRMARTQYLSFSVFTASDIISGRRKKE